MGSGITDQSSQQPTIYNSHSTPTIVNCLKYSVGIIHGEETSQTLGFDERTQAGGCFSIPPLQEFPRVYTAPYIYNVCPMRASKWQVQTFLLVQSLSICYLPIMFVVLGSPCLYAHPPQSLFSRCWSFADLLCPPDAPPLPP